MITVNCKGIEAVMSKLAIHIADQVGVVPMLKAHEFTLLPTGDEEVDINKVVDSIRDFLKIMGKGKDFAVTAKNNNISITSLNGEDLKPVDGNDDFFFVCQHCGHITKYESIHKNHEKLHYIGYA